MVADETMAKTEDEIKYRIAHYLAENTDSIFVAKHMIIQPYQKKFQDAGKSGRTHGDRF